MLSLPVGLPQSFHNPLGRTRFRGPAVPTASSLPWCTRWSKPILIHLRWPTPISPLHARRWSGVPLLPSFPCPPHSRLDQEHALPSVNSRLLILVDCLRPKFISVLSKNVFFLTRSNFASTLHTSSGSVKLRSARQISWSMKLSLTRPPPPGVPSLEWFALAQDQQVVRTFSSPPDKILSPLSSTPTGLRTHPPVLGFLSAVVRDA